MVFHPQNRRPMQFRNRRRPVGRPVDPVITAQRFPVVATHVPQHVVAPTVVRTVRLNIILTSGTPNAFVSYNQIALQDAADYSTGATLRYATMRVIQVRAWAESPQALSVSQAPYGLLLGDLESGFDIKDKPTTGSRLNAIGLRFPFVIRQTVALTTSTTQLLQVSCDTSIAASTDFVVTLDFNVEFYG